MRGGEDILAITSQQTRNARPQRVALHRLLAVCMRCKVHTPYGIDVYVGSGNERGEVSQPVVTAALPHHDADQLGGANDHLGNLAASQRAYHRLFGQGSRTQLVLANVRRHLQPAAYFALDLNHAGH